MSIIAIHSNDFTAISNLISRDESSLHQIQDIFTFDFEIFDTVNVNGELAHPIFKYLKNRLEGLFDNSIKWNFSKFLIDRNGIPHKRYSPLIDPLELENDIEQLLKTSAETNNGIFYTTIFSINRFFF